MYAQYYTLLYAVVDKLLDPDLSLRDKHFFSASLTKLTHTHVCQCCLYICIFMLKLWFLFVGNTGGRLAHIHVQVHTHSKSYMYISERDYAKFDQTEHNR